MRNFLLCVSTILVAWLPVAVADSNLGTGNSSFTLNCEESSARTFMDADSEGRDRSAKWTNSGTAGPKQWIFQYNGSSVLHINDDPAKIIANQNGVMLAISYGSSSVGSNGWMYVIHLGLKRIVASTVGGYGDALGKGVYGTIIELTCVTE